MIGCDAFLSRGVDHPCGYHYWKCSEGGMCRDRVLIGLIVVVDQRHSASRRRQNGLSLMVHSVNYNMYRLRSTVSFCLRVCR